EEARVQMMARAGVAVSPDKMCVLAHTSCDFLKPLHYPAIAVVSQVLLRLGRSSIEMEVRLEREDEPGVLYAKGRYVLVYADSASGKSIPWSAAELGALAAVLKA